MIRVVTFVNILIVSFFLTACSDKILTTTQQQLPAVQEKQKISIILFDLQNYTDTPRAGKRAANIVEGVLASKAYHVSYYPKSLSLPEALSIAKKQNVHYLMNGAVSEWRYKTGIDGEPAVSLRLALYEVESGKLIWSGVGANNDWGKGSIGTTAQSLIEEMFN
jgi:PBP1b-binding outer membrane lipoprotein LpoB